MNLLNFLFNVDKWDDIELFGYSIGTYSIMTIIGILLFAKILLFFL